MALSQQDISEDAVELCPSCGEANPSSSLTCLHCGRALSDFARQTFTRRARNAAVALAVLATVWELATHWMGGGRLTGVVNISFLLLTVIPAMILPGQLKSVLPRWSIWLVAPLSWVLLVAVLRTLESAALDAIF